MLTTNRLKFVTVDTSAVTPLPSPIVGFTVIKAPKGTALPVLVNRGDINSALQLFGTPSSTYPDIQNVLDYVQNYSIYVSAPPGTGTSVAPSYFGGLYATTLGSFEQLYQVPEDVDGTPAFNNQILVDAGNVISPFSSSILAPTGANVSGTENVTIDSLNPLQFNSTLVGSIQISYIRSDNSTCVITAYISGSNIVTYQPSDTTKTTPIIIGSIGSGTANASLKKVVLTGSASTYVNGTYTTDILFGSTNQTLIASNVGAGTFKFKYVLDITSYIILAFYQTSQRAIPGNLKLVSIDTTSHMENGQSVYLPSYNTAQFTYTETAYTGKTFTKTFTLSSDINKLDGQNSSLYAENVLGKGNNNFLVAEVFPAGLQFSNTSTAYTQGTTYSFVGQRGITTAGYTDAVALETTLTAGWNTASSNDYLNTNIYIDGSGYASIATIFANMRASSNLTATYISPIKVPDASSNGVADTIVANIITARSSRPNQTGLAYYCNELLTKEAYTGTSFWTTPVGAIGAMLSLIMDHKLGGVAPEYTNEGNPSLGGEITFSATRQKYNFSANNLDSLDGAGINAVIRDINYGVMLMSHRTAQAITRPSDWSYLGHTMAFDLVYREIQQNVMFPQLGKPIDPEHMALRRTQTESILNARTSGETKIWDSALVLIEEVNTAETKAQNNFILKVRVKVYPFSEYVTLEFDTVGQSETV